MNFKRTPNLTLYFLLFLIASILSACWTIPGIVSRQTVPLGETGESDLANGERIYFTAANAQGERIPYSDGPVFGGMMMGSYLTCAACHGPEARGGLHRMHMQVMDAPDIRYSALVGEAEEHEDEGDDAHEDEHAGYDLEDFRLAVVEGKHPDGEPLDTDMPRWQMDDDDLADLFNFLKEIPQ
jgi:hypothetical protein